MTTELRPGLSQLDPNVGAVSDARIRRRIDEATHARLVGSARPKRSHRREVFDWGEDVVGRLRVSGRRRATQIEAPLGIADIVYDAPGNDVEFNNSEFVVLRNNGTGTVELGGWALEDEANHTITIPSGYMIAPGAELRVYTGPGDDNTDKYFDGRGQAIWKNTGGDTATLSDASGQTIDTYSYSS